MKLTVEAADGALIARLDGYRPGVLDADRAADLFFDAVLAALQPEPTETPAVPQTAPDRGAATERQVDPPRTPTAPASVAQGTSCATTSGSVVAQHGPVPAAPAVMSSEHLLGARPEAVRRLDEGQDVADVARALGVPVAIVRRWDTDPTWAAS